MFSGLDIILAMIIAIVFITAIIYIIKHPGECTGNCENCSKNVNSCGLSKSKREKGTKV